MRVATVICAAGILGLGAAGADACSLNASTGFTDAGADTGVVMVGMDTGVVGPGTSVGTGTGSGVVTSGSGSGTSPGSGPGMEAGAGDSGACTGTVCCPHALPAGFATTLHPTPGGICTSSTVESYASSCSASGGSVSACQSATMTPCGQCIAGATNTATAWGPEIVVVTTGGATPVSVPYPNYNFGGCVLAADPSTPGKACAQAFQGQIECELAACVPYCPVTDATDSLGIDALLGTFDPMSGELTVNGCIENADNTVCQSYIVAEDTACAPDFSDASAAMVAGNECLATIAAANGSAAAFAEFAGAYCGGADAGL